MPAFELLSTATRGLMLYGRNFPPAWRGIVTSNHISMSCFDWKG